MSVSKTLPVLALLLPLVAFGAARPASAATPSHALQTAIVDPTEFTGPDAPLALKHAKAAGAQVIKVALFWNSVASGAQPPSSQAANPASPDYNWSGMDSQLRLLHSEGLQPIVYISGAPTWAYAQIDGGNRVDAAKYKAFTLAAVRRYSGTFQGLPRVRLWQAWNEPNKVPGPSSKPGTETWYRGMVNAFAASAHSVAGNEVIAGGLAPFGISTAIAPLSFMQNLLCVHPTCHKPIHFDVWSTDPYTAGGPTHLATHRGDVSIAELPAMKAVLDAAARAHVVVSARPPLFWVTEFSWDSKPPDPAGVPAALEGRWVAQGLYDMWKAGVSLVTWFTLRDQPISTSPYQSGLYYRGSSLATDRPKPAFTAFRFPFVAFPAGKTITVWGRTPTSKPGSVRIEQSGSGGWKRVATLSANRYGIFSGVLTTGKRGPLRAVFAPASAVSLPFSLVSPPDHTYKPFGSLVTGTSAVPPSLSSAASQYVELAPSAGRDDAVTVMTGAATGGGPGSALSAAADAVSTGGNRSLWLIAGLVGLTALLAVAGRGSFTADKR